MRILVLEDEKALAGLIDQTLQRDGYGVAVVHTIAEARKKLEQPFDAVISDRRLPDGDGLDFIADIRSQGNAIPVLMLTAMGSPQERVKGLDKGADDYLPKPFSLYELQARLRALLRRTGGPQGIKLSAGNIELDTLHNTVSIGGKTVGLGKREVILLTHLLRQAGTVVGKEVLTSALYGDKAAANALEVAIHRLRKELEKAGSNVALETVRGVGYWLRTN
jgi:DNA-binding response OmpR family regulator